LTTCSFDFLSANDETRVFVACIFIWAYCLPMILIAFFYTNLFKHVRAHENMLKAQAKRMNVQSLSANKDATAQSVEIRIAKAAFTIFFMFVCAWTPYAVVALIGAFGNRQLLTPLVTMIPAVCCKIVSCIDPWVYAISHPRYRAVLEKRLPCLGIKEDLKEEDSKSAITTVTAAPPPVDA
jgi:r-opsin